MSLSTAVLAQIPWSAQGSRTLADACEEFIREKSATGCSQRTIGIYQGWLQRLHEQVGNDVSMLDAAAVARFLASLRERHLSDSTVHQAYRTLKTFTRWLVETGVLARNPMTGMRVKTPATLPHVPTVEELKAVLGCCPDTFEGHRNCAMILFISDSGVRSQELRRIRIEHLDLQTGSVRVRGKGQKERIVFISSLTVEAVRDYLAKRREVIGGDLSGSDYLFADAKGQQLKARHLVQILHRLSERAGLPKNRRPKVHGLRHFAATNWIRAGIGLDQVRRLLGHSTLSTTLRYVSLVPADLQQAHRDAAVIERLGLLPDRNRSSTSRARRKQNRAVFTDDR